MNPYFFDGYVQHTDANYGLYDVINNRFVVVSTELEVLKRSVLLLSSRVHLYIVPLHQSSNYNPTLIDNHCCQNWGLGDIIGSDLFTEIETPEQMIIDPVPVLVENKNPVQPIEHELQQFAFLSHSVIKHWRENSSWYYRDYYDFVAWPESLQQSKALERSVYHAIYHALEYSTALAQVQELMS